MSSRSLKVRTEFIEKVKSAVRRNGFRRQKDLALDVGIALSTVNNFLTGRYVDIGTFEEICFKLGLDWQEIADLNPSTEVPEPDHEPNEEPDVDRASVLLSEIGQQRKNSSSSLAEISSTHLAELR